MVRSVPIALFVAVLAASPAMSADPTISFENATTILADNCGKDIEANCFGVNLDTTRLKECLSRNQDVVSAQCRANYFRAFDAIQKRISSRYAVYRACEREKTKVCAATEGKPAE